MRKFIGNWENNTVTTISSSPTRRQLVNALKRMGVDVTNCRRYPFRYAAVGDRSINDELINEFNGRWSS